MEGGLRERLEGGLRKRLEGVRCEEASTEGTAGEGKGRPGRAGSVTSLRGVAVSSTVESLISSSMPSSSY